MHGSNHAVQKKAALLNACKHHLPIGCGNLFAFHVVLMVFVLYTLLIVGPCAIIY